MTTITKFSENDYRLIMLLERRNLTPEAIKNYDTVFKEIYDLCKVTPSDIVRIGKREQKPYVDKENGDYELLELEDRSVTKFQFQYYNFLKDKNLAPRTINLKLNTYRALLTEYDIEKPKRINIVIQTDRIRDEDIVSWRDVELALSFCKGIRDKAIISFIATTGLRSSDVRKLTIGDLIKACDIYFDGDEEKTIDNLLTKNPEDIMPCWEIIPSKTSKKSQLCVTFNTPEASTYLWQYLNDRIEFNIKKNRNELLEPNDPLFATSTNNELKSTALEQLFQRLNKQLGDEKDKNGKYGKFRAHSLRKLFSTTCRRKLTQVVVNSDKTSEVDIVSIFTGHVPPNESNSRVYEAIESDSHDSYLRKTYLALSPYLSIKDIEVKDIKTQQYKDLEEQNEALRKQLGAQAASMQREMDEQKEQYEKKIRHIESVNSALSSKVTDIQKQIDDMTNVNNVNRILDYITSNELVNKYHLADKIVELYREDIDKDKSLIVIDSYIDTLITRAYNSLPEYRVRGTRKDGAEKQNDEEYIKLKNKVMFVKNRYIKLYNLMLSDSQEELLNDKLTDYCAELWWNYTYKFDRKHVTNLVKKIAIEGRV